MVSVEATSEGNPSPAGQFDSQPPDAGPHGFTTDAHHVPSTPPKRWRPLGRREILAWTVAALTAFVIAAALFVVVALSASTSQQAPVPAARAVAVTPVPASPTAGLGARQPPEPTAAPIPLAALPKADPPKTAARPAASQSIASKKKAARATTTTATQSTTSRRTERGTAKRVKE